MSKKIIYLLLRLAVYSVITVFGLRAYGQQWPTTPPAEQVPVETIKPAGVVDISFFYDRLSPYGEWLNHGKYGWCWRPYGMPADWRPYTDGQWVYTDDFGWVWNSDYEWGWACFHYGRWFYEDKYGWCWVPGYEWGPGWVAWRSGSDYVGWIPLPPEVGWHADTRILDDYAFDDIPSQQWVFVENRYFGQPGIREHCLAAQYNAGIIGTTRNITQFGYVNGRIFNSGVSIGFIEKSRGGHLEHFRISDVDALGAMYVPHHSSDTLFFFRPGVRQSPVALVPPAWEDFDRRHGAEIVVLRERHHAEFEFLHHRHRGELERGGNLIEIRRRHELEDNSLRLEHQKQLQFIEIDHRRQRDDFSHGRGRSGGRQRDLIRGFDDRPGEGPGFDRRGGRGGGDDDSPGSRDRRGGRGGGGRH